MVQNGRGLVFWKASREKPNRLYNDGTMLANRLSFFTIIETRFQHFFLLKLSGLGRDKFFQALPEVCYQVENVVATATGLME